MCMQKKSSTHGSIKIQRHWRMNFPPFIIFCLHFADFISIKFSASYIQRKYIPSQLLVSANDGFCFVWIWFYLSLISFATHLIDLSSFAIPIYLCSLIKQGRDHLFRHTLAAFWLSGFLAAVKTIGIDEKWHKVLFLL